MKLESFKSVLLCWTIGLYMLFNYGFMQLRIPPVKGGGVPVGEIVLIFSLITMNYSKIVPRFNQTVKVYPFLIFLALGLGSAFWGFIQYGMWSLRDATNVIESLFIFVGFSIYQNTNNLERFFYWLPRILLVTCIYALSYPFSKFLIPFSPKLMAGAGHEVTLFFTYIGIPVILLLSSCNLLLFAKLKTVKQRTVIILIATFIWVYTISFFQARIIYFQIIGLLFVFLLFKKKLFSFGIIIVLLTFLIIWTLPKIGIQIKGRLGQPTSIDFISNHFQTSFGIPRQGLEGTAGGVSQRLKWWTDLYYKWIENPKAFLFGLGYGFPLVDFIAFGEEYAVNGQVVREPHNSFISIFARIGLIGGIAFILLHAQLFKAWKNSYEICSSINDIKGQNQLLVLLMFFVLIWINAIGEDALEKPFFAIPYYLFWGIVLSIFSHLKNHVSQEWNN